ncbi:MAG TPA: protein-tyrosine phosphatase family protein [Candidatus Limnocylindria bacterium]
MGGAPDPAPAHAGFDEDLRVDWLAAEELGDGLPGRLGMTFLPGKRGASNRYPGHVYRRDTAADLSTMLRLGIVRLVLLVEDRELERWADPAIVDIGARLGLDVRRHPIPDGRAPASLEQMDAILADVREGRRSGDVAVACMGGVGRTGTVASCALVAAGLAARQAIERVRAVRHPTAVETAAQERFVSGFERRERGIES